MRRHRALGLGLLLSLGLGLAACQPGDPEPSAHGAVGGAEIQVDVGGASARYSQRDLLARSDIVDVMIRDDPNYHRPRRYRAIALGALVSRNEIANGDTLLATALDGYTVAMDAAAAVGTNAGRATAFLAIEDPLDRWPALPGRTGSAGPFALIWVESEPSPIGSDRWIYQLGSLALVHRGQTRAARFALPGTLPARDPLRIGEAAFTRHCSGCHRLAGTGEGDVGPDLAKPMGPTEYFQRAALHRYIRDPASVRDWRGRRMHGFSERDLGDDSIEALIDYLAFAARRVAEGKANPRAAATERER